MKLRGLLRWRTLIALLAVVLLAEWAARSFVSTPGGARPERCRIAVPAPAIGNEPGSSTITATYKRDRTFGWLPSRRSPHYPDIGQIPRDGSGWIAAFGDSVLAGPPDLPGGTIPARLNVALPVPVVSYAVAGHGLARIVARFEATLANIEIPPRTALVAFRIDAVEHLSDTASPPPSTVWRLALLEWLQASLAPPPAAHAEGESCEYAPDRAQLRSLLETLQSTAEQHGIELVVSLHAPAVPVPRHTAYLDLVREELDALAIHHADAWKPAQDLGVREQDEAAAALLARRLGVSADYVWGTRIEFGKQGNVARYEMRGFGPPAGPVRWTLDTTATIQITPPKGPSAIVADIEFATAIAIDGDPRELVVRVGEVAVGRWPMSRLRKRTEDSFFIDAGIAAARPLELRFELEPLHSQFELGQGEDRTKRGVAVTSLRLRPEAKENE